MKWTLKEPVFGDVIRVKFSADFYHFGIYVSDDEVIQFGLSPDRRAQLSEDEVEVLASGIDEFLGGRFLEVAEYDKKETKKNRTPEQTVEFARSRIGQRGYNLISNNCEHFANECKTGRSFCAQADELRKKYLLSRK